MTIPSMAWVAGITGLIAGQPIVPATLAQPRWVSQAWQSTDRWWRCPNALAQSQVTPQPSQFPIRFQGCIVGYLSNAMQAQAISARLDRELQNPTTDWQAVRPQQVGQAIVLQRGNVPLFTLEPAIAQQFNAHPHTLAIDWSNRIRTLAGQAPLPLAEAQKQLYEVTETAIETTGSASWYGPYFHGRQTANGEIYNQHDLTAAHRTLPLGSYVKVTHRRSGKSVVVRINDRGPYHDEDRRIIDLSQRAAQLLGGEEQGIIPIDLVELRSTPRFL